ncbi:MAG TPA: AsmA family protein [Gammaproteobacteria bacterium]|nr:AsmA family protein [Gammaproteobacteria bacterium]
MQKIIRYVLIGLAVVIILPVVAVGIFVAVFDANAYKQDMSSLVLEQTGRELRFQGDVSLTLYPALGMQLGAMSFANAPAFGELPMVRIGAASVSVDVLSLLRLAPEIDKLILRDLEINLIRNKAGVNNWDDLLQPSSATPGSAAASSSSEATGTTSAPAADEFALKGAFAGLEIENLKLLWLDEQAGERYQVTDLDISTGRIAPNESFPLTLHLDASAGGDLDIVFDLKTNVEYLIDQQRLTLNQMILALNEFNIGGMLQVSNFARPALRFDLASQLLDVDALLGTPAADAAAPQPTTDEQNSTGAAEDIQIALPMQTLRDLDIDGELKIAKMKIQNLHMTDFSMRLKAQQGLVALKPVNLKMYDGEVLANVVVDVTGALPKYGVDESLKGVQVGDLLNDYLGKSPISGKVDGDVNLTTRGEWLSKLKANSNGTMQLAFLDGALNGFNIRQSIDTAKAKLRGEAPPAEKTLKTDFSSLTISGVIKNGVFSSTDLDLQAPLLRVGGKGSADLNSELVDYLVNAKLVGTTAGQEGGSADDLAGLSIPVRIKGPFSDPEIDVQLDEMLKAKVDAQKAKLKAEIDAQKAALQKQLEAEKQALAAEKKEFEEAKKRELEIKAEIEKAKAQKKLEDKLKKLLE